MSHTTYRDDDIEMSPSPTYPGANGPEGNIANVWQWICGAMLVVLLFVAGYAVRGGITRAEAEQLVNGPSNPYVAERDTIQLKEKNTQDRLDKIESDMSEMNRQLVNISVALGIQPDGTRVPRRK